MGGWMIYGWEVSGEYVLCIMEIHIVSGLR